MLYFFAFYVCLCVCVLVNCLVTVKFTCHVLNGVPYHFSAMFFSLVYTYIAYGLYLCSMLNHILHALCCSVSLFFSSFLEAVDGRRRLLLVQSLSTLYLSTQTLAIVLEVNHEYIGDRERWGWGKKKKRK